MIYSTTNMTLSIYRQFADLLRGKGYDIYWDMTQEREQRVDTTVNAKGTITLCSEFPANPTQVVRLSSGGPAEWEVVVPAFAIQVLGSPRKIRRAGIGDPTFERERRFRIDGFARDSFEHRELADALYDWLQESDKRLDVWNYDASAGNPALLEPVLLWDTSVDRQELTSGDEAHRYYINLSASVRYFE